MRRNRLALLVVASGLLAGGIPLAVGAQGEGEAASTASAVPEGIPSAPRGVCIRPDARQNVERCPDNAPPPSKRAGSRPTGVDSQVASHFRETKRREEETDRKSVV